MKKKAAPRKRNSRASPSDKKYGSRITTLFLQQLARGLHDGPIQAVAALAMQADLANRLLDRNPASATAELKKLEELARRTTRELRHLQFTLRPLSLESSGLHAALDDLAQHDHELYGGSVQINVDPDAERGLSAPQKELLFRIVTDAISNAHKAGLATRIDVALKRSKSKTLSLEIQDNGTGFDLKKSNSTQESDYGKGDFGLGIELMKLRASILGGHLRIDTQSGLGTSVRVSIPVR